MLKRINDKLRQAVLEWLGIATDIAALWDIVRYLSDVVDGDWQRPTRAWDKAGREYTAYLTCRFEDGKLRIIDSRTEENKE
jgi:hypothetical protein